MRREGWPGVWPVLWPEVWPIALPDSLPFLPRFLICVVRCLGEGGNIGALGVPAIRASMPSLPEILPEALPIFLPEMWPILWLGMWPKMWPGNGRRLKPGMAAALCSTAKSPYGDCGEVRMRAVVG